MRVYGRFAEEAGPSGRDMFQQEGRISQRIIVGDVATVAAELTDYILDHGFTDVVTWGAAPGLPPEHLTPSMERFAREVVPLVRAAVEGR